jgi:hypothetical protein
MSYEEEDTCKHLRPQLLTLSIPPLRPSAPHVLGFQNGQRQRRREGPLPQILPHILPHILKSQQIRTFYCEYSFQKYTGTRTPGTQIDV